MRTYKQGGYVGNIQLDAKTRAKIRAILASRLRRAFLYAVNAFYKSISPTTK